MSEQASSTQVSKRRAMPSKLVWLLMSVVVPVAALCLLAGQINPYAQTIVTLILIASVSAMALTVLMGVAGQPSLLTAALLLSGGYCGNLFVNALGLPFVLAVVGTFLVGAIIGAIAAVPALRLSGMYLLLSTLAMHVIITDGGNVLQTDQLATAGYFLTDPSLFGYVIQSSTQWVIFSGLIVLAVYHYLRYLARSRVGRAWTLIREAGGGASGVVGVNSGRYIIYAFALTSGIMAIGGLLLGFYTHNVSYDGFDLLTSVSYIVMVVVGGTGSLVGAIIGAGFVTALPFILQAVFPDSSGTGFLAANLTYIELIGYGLIGLLILVFLPGGIVGASSVIRRWRAAVWPAGDSRASSRVRKAMPANGAGGESDPTVVDVESVSVRYAAGETGLAETSVGIPAGGLLAVLGRNGAGKTTLLHSIVGFPPGAGGRVTAGDVVLKRDGERVSLTRLSPAARVAKGIVFVPAEDKVFRALSVREHLVEALASRSGGRAGPDALAAVLEEFPALRDRLNSPATSLSGGERQQLALAAALARDARVLAVDEASLGLSPIAIGAITRLLRRVRTPDRSLIVVEQSPRVGFAVADRVVLLEGGRVRAEGLPTPQLQQTIDEMYLGFGTLKQEAAGPPARASQRAGAAAPPVLRLEHVTLRIGGVQALKDVSLTLAAGQSVGLIGPNGAGKTSLINVVCGNYRASSGDVLVAGVDASRLSSNRIIGRGVGRTFQSPGQIVDLTVLEFVQLGFEPRWPSPVLGDIVGAPGSQRTEKTFRAEAEALLEGAGLADYRTMRCGDVPYGVRKMADIVRALAGKPQVLLLDEPTSGIAAAERPRIRDLISTYQETSGAAILLVDHDVDFVSGLCPDLVVLASGSVIASGARDAVLADPKVIETFIGAAPDAVPEPS